MCSNGEGHCYGMSHFPGRVPGVTKSERQRGKQRSIGPRRPVMSWGYRFQWAPDHPLANKWGYVAEARMVAYDAGMELVCHVCGTEHTWATVTIDHLDQDKLNNDLGNIAPACLRCNSRRTASRNR